MYSGLGVLRYFTIVVFLDICEYNSVELVSTPLLNF
jgi:hypothetical protein